MNLLGLQILTAFLVFLIFILVGAVPFCVITYRLNRSSSRNRRAIQKEDSSGINFISLANCFACGIFLSACFVGLIPHVRHESLMLKAMILNRSDPDGTRFGPVTLQQFVEEHEARGFGEKLMQMPDTELLILIGFVFILVLEQLVGLCHRHGTREKKHKTDHSKVNGDSRWINHAEFEPLVSGGDDDEVHDELMGSELANGDSSFWTGGQPPVETRGTTTNDLNFQEEMGENGSTRLFDSIPMTSTGSRSQSSSEARRRKSAEAGEVETPIHEADKLNFQSIILLFGLGVHAIFEGLAIGLQNNRDSFIQILLAVMLHEVLCVFAFGLSLAKQRASMGYGFLSLCVLSLSIPLGMFIGIPVPKTNTFTTTLIRYLLEGLASGIFVYVATVEMLAGELNGGGHGHSHGDAGGSPHSHNHAHPTPCTNLVKVITVSAGVIAFLIVALVVP